MAMHHPASALALIGLLLSPLRAADGEHDPFSIRVVDDATGRGVPLVEVRTVNHVLYTTDSSGIVISAIDFTTNTITIPTTTVADNDVVVAENGSASCRGFLYDFIKLRDILNEIAVDKIGQLLIDGKINRAFLLGDIAAIITQANATTPLVLQFIDGIQIWNNNVRDF